MKKLILSLSIIGAITIGTGAIAFAAEEESPVINSGEAVVSDTENYNIAEDNNSGLGNPNCPYYGEENRGQGQGNGEGNRYGLNSENRGRGNCGRSGSMMGFRYGVEK
jgi:hypothetical protein